MTRVLHDLVLPARVEHLGELFALIDSVATAAALPESRRSALTLVIEEAFVNVCRHAYREREDGEVGVRVAGSDRELVVDIRDSGPPFDPLAAPPPNLNASFEERRPGGLGIELMRRLTDELSYERRGGENVLRIVFRWA